jgi:16S rRNA (adenine1518-N6/adenine1519-N6)-dimethyltransferase
VIKAAFAHRRKTLVNSLGEAGEPVVTRAGAEAVLRALGWPLSVRGETLSLADFVRLTDALKREKHLP